MDQDDFFSGLGFSQDLLPESSFESAFWVGPNLDLTIADDWAHSLFAAPGQAQDDLPQSGQPQEMFVENLSQQMGHLNVQPSQYQTQQTHQQQLQTFTLPFITQQQTQTQTQPQPHSAPQMQQTQRPKIENIQTFAPVAHPVGVSATGVSSAVSISPVGSPNYTLPSTSVGSPGSNYPSLFSTQGAQYQQPFSTYPISTSYSQHQSPPSNIVSLSHQPSQKSSSVPATTATSSPSSVIQTCVDANLISSNRIQQLISQQQAFLANPTGEEKWRELQSVLQQLHKDLTNQQKVLQYVNKQVILEPYPLHQAYYLESSIEVDMKQLELLYNQLCSFISQSSLPSAATVALVVSRQPFPDVLMKDKQLSDEVLHVQLLTAAGLGVEPLSPVHAESDLMCKETAPILFTEQTLDLVTRVAKFPLKANLGSRKSLVHLKFSVDVRVDGEAFRLNSAPTKPFIVITNDNQWEDAMELIFAQDTFQRRKEVEWNIFCNSIQRHFLRATYQDPSSPSRYLSTLDFIYFHDKFFSNSQLVYYDKFLEFWRYFGKALHVLRFHRVVIKLWQIGLIYGFMSRTDINNALLAHEPGTFIVRFSESYPGQFVIAYVSEGGNIKHYLVERADLEKKTFPEFLLECKEFTNILQCIGFTSDAKRPVFRAIHKTNALSYFTQTLTTTPTSAKPGYDPLDTHWPRVASDKTRLAQKRRKRGADGEPQ